LYPNASLVPFRNLMLPSNVWWPYCFKCTSFSQNNQVWNGILGGQVWEPGSSLFLIISENTGCLQNLGNCDLWNTELPMTYLYGGGATSTGVWMSMKLSKIIVQCSCQVSLPRGWGYMHWCVSVKADGKTGNRNGVISAKLEIKETNHKASLHKITVLGMQPITIQKIKMAFVLSLLVSEIT